MPKISRLRTKHPDYDLKRIQRLRALYEGGQAFHRHKKHWMPKNPAEGEKLYEERMKLSTYENLSGSILDMVASWLFADEAKLNNLEGEYWTELWNDTGLSKKPWNALFRSCLIDALVAQRWWIWVDLPPAPLAAVGQPIKETRAQQEARGGLNAFLKCIKPEHVRNWSLSDGTLEWLVVEDQVFRQPYPLEKGRWVWRWTIIDEVSVRRYEYVERDASDTPLELGPDGEEEADLVFEVNHGFPGVPVVTASLDDGLWAMNKLEDPSISHVRGRNELSWALYRAAVILLALKRKWDDGPPELGQGYFLQLGMDDDVKFIEPSGTAIQLLRQDVQDRRTAVFRAMNQLAMSADPTASSFRQSGTAKALDWVALKIVLEAYSRIVRSSMLEVVKMIAGIRGEDASNAKITGLDAWRTETTEDFLTSAAMATEAKTSSNIFRAEIAKREAHRILADEVDPDVLQAIKNEIDKFDFTSVAADSTKPVGGRFNFSPEGEGSKAGSPPNVAVAA